MLRHSSEESRLKQGVVQMKSICTLLAGAALAIGLGASAQAANLIVNGGFETGDFTGWTVVENNTGVETTGYDGLYPHSGTYFAALGNVGCCGTISQTVSDTAGEALTLTYFHMSDGGTPNYFETDWDGVAIAGSIINNAPDQRGSGYVEYQFDVTGTGSDTLQFVERNDPSYDALDDVSLTGAIPEPASWAMMMLGLFGAGAILRSRRRQGTALA